MLSSWNIPEIGICSMWHSSGPVQAGVLGHSQDQRDAPSPSAGLPRSGGRHPWECRGREGRGSRLTLLLSVPPESPGKGPGTLRNGRISRSVTVEEEPGPNTIAQLLLFLPPRERTGAEGAGGVGLCLGRQRLGQGSKHFPRS